METISDWVEIISDWDADDFEQAFILLGFIVFGLFGTIGLVYRIYAFFFRRRALFLGRTSGVKKRTPNHLGLGNLDN